MKLRMMMLCLCGTLIFTGGVPVLAAETSMEDYGIMPAMTYIDHASADLSISSSGKATVKSTIFGVDGATKRVTISAKLERYENGRWITIQTFSKSSTTFYAVLTENYQVSKGYTYRVSASVRAYTSSSSEGQTVVSSKVTY